MKRLKYYVAGKRPQMLELRQAFEAGSSEDRSKVCKGIALLAL
jgi:hypothetical protein